MYRFGISEVSSVLLLTQFRCLSGSNVIAQFRPFSLPILIIDVKSTAECNIGAKDKSDTELTASVLKKRSKTHKRLID